MSVARVQVVKSSRKDQGKCGKCHKDLPKGSAYKWWTVGFRSRYVYKRCMDQACAPRTSELESSKLSEVYAAQETAQDELAGLRGNPGEDDDLTSIVSTFAEEVQRVAEEYREADEAIGGGGTGTISEERADSLDEAVNELEGFTLTNSVSDFEECDDADTDGHEVDACEACEQNKRDHWDTMVDEAESAIGDVSL